MYFQLQLSWATLTAAVDKCRAGRQENLLEFWRNDSNRRLVYSRLCQVEKKKLPHQVSLPICDKGDKSSLFSLHEAEL